MAIRKTFRTSLTFGSNVDNTGVEILIEKLLEREFLSFAKNCPDHLMSKEKRTAIGEAFQEHGEVSVEWEEDEEAEDEEDIE